MIAPRTQLANVIVGTMPALLLAALLPLVTAARASAASGDTTLISRQSDSMGGAGADDLSSFNGVSGDGRYVVFESEATNLSDVDQDRVVDIFVRDTATGTTTLVSRQSAARGGEAGNDHSYEPAISADGRFVAFISQATNLSGKRIKRDHESVYLRDLVHEKTVLVARDASRPAISGNGRHVAFITERRKGPRSAVVRDMRRKRDTLVSRQSDGRGGDRASGNTDEVSISASGRYVAFESPASNLSDKDRRGRDVFLRDVKRKTTRLVSLESRARGGEAADCCSELPAISPDGRYVAFESSDRLSEADTNSVDDVYLRDVERGTTKLVSRQGAADGGAVQDAGPPVEPRVPDLFPSVSGRGLYVAFHSSATNLSDVDSDTFTDSEDVFIRSTKQRTTELVSRASNSEGRDPGNGDSFLPTVSADGRFVAFASDAGNLSDVDDPSPGFTDVFVRQVR